MSGTKTIGAIAVGTRRTGHTGNHYMYIVQK